jgi:hypothetical protein
MPVDLSVGNSIVDAFAKGRQLMLQKQQLDQEQANQTLERQQRQQQLDQQNQQFKDELKQKADQFDAAQNLAKAHFQLSQITQLPAFQELAERSGQIPGASSEPFVNPDGTTDPTKNTFHLPEALGGYNVNALTPEAATQRDVNRERSLLGPKSDAELNLKKFESDLITKREEQKQLSEALQRQYDRQSREDIAKAKLRSALEIAKMKNVNTADAKVASDAFTTFRNSPVAKNFLTMQEAYGKALSVLNHAVAEDGITSKDNGSDDTSLVYAFIRAQHPESLSRGGSEQELVRDNAQTVAQRFGFKVDNLNTSSAFLSPETRQEMKDSIAKNYDIYSKQYDQLRKQTIDILNERKVPNAERAVLNDKTGFEHLDEPPVSFTPNANTPLHKGYMYAFDRATKQVGQIPISAFDLTKYQRAVVKQ